MLSEEQGNNHTAFCVGLKESISQGAVFLCVEDTGAYGAV